MKYIIGFCLIMIVSIHARAQDSSRVFPNEIYRFTDTSAKIWQERVKSRTLSDVEVKQLVDEIHTLSVMVAKTDKEKNTTRSSYFFHYQANLYGVAAVLIHSQPGFFENRSAMKTALALLDTCFAFYKKAHEMFNDSYRLFVSKTMYKDYRFTFYPNPYYVLQGQILEKTDEPLKAINAYKLAFQERFKLIPPGDKDSIVVHESVKAIIGLGNRYTRTSQEHITFCAKLLEAESDWKSRGPKDVLLREVAVMALDSVLADPASQGKKYEFPELTSWNYKYLLTVINKFDDADLYFKYNQKIARYNPDKFVFISSVMGAVSIYHDPANAEVKAAALKFINANFHLIAIPARASLSDNTRDYCDKIEWIFVTMKEFPLPAEDAEYIKKRYETCGKKVCSFCYQKK